MNVFLQVDKIFVVLPYRLLSELIMNKKMMYLLEDYIFNVGALNGHYEAFPLYCA